MYCLDDISSPNKCRRLHEVTVPNNIQIHHMDTFTLVDTCALHNSVLI